MITAMEKSTAEQKIKDYYKGLREIERNKKKLEMLLRQKTEVENDISNSNISLEINLRGIAYDGLNIQITGIKSSSQERALENAISFLEKQLESLEAQVIEVKTELRILENQIHDVEYAIDQLSNEEKCILKLIYKDKKTYLQVGIILNMSHASVSRKNNKVIECMLEGLI